MSVFPTHVGPGKRIASGLSGLHQPLTCISTLRVKSSMTSSCHTIGHFNMRGSGSSIASFSRAQSALVVLRTNESAAAKSWLVSVDSFRAFVLLIPFWSASSTMESGSLPGFLSLDTIVVPFLRTSFGTLTHVYSRIFGISLTRRSSSSSSEIGWLCTIASIPGMLSGLSRMSLSPKLSI